MKMKLNINAMKKDTPTLVVKNVAIRCETMEGLRVTA